MADVKLILDVFDKDFKRIGVISKYQFLQYSEEFKGIGSGSISLTSTDRNRKLINSGARYILVEEKLMYEIVKVESSDEVSDVIKLTIESIDRITTKRVVISKKLYSGQIEKVVEDLLNDNFINTEENRKVKKLKFIPGTATGKSIDQSQFLGKQVNVVFEEIFEGNDCGYHITPELTKYVDGSNIGNLNFNLYIGQKRKNVLFSRVLGNVENNSYSFNRQTEKTTAYVYNEDQTGGGQDKQVILNSGNANLDRMEVFVTSTASRQDQEGQTIPDDEFTKVLQNEGFNILGSNRIYEDYDASINVANRIFTYGKDYKLGDYVYNFDSNTERLLELQVTSVTKTFDGKGYRLDIGFGQPKPVVWKMLEKRL